MQETEEQTMAALTDPKLMVILEAAFEAFARYGFRRTSMEDIAKGADMSRAALYLHFKNKNDIFRSLIRVYYARATEELKVALHGHEDPAAALLAGFEAQTGEGFRALLDSPHGQELIDTKHASSAEEAAEGEAALVAIYADWLRAGAAAGTLDFTTLGGTAEAVGDTMLKALYGLKVGVSDYAEFAEARDRLARMFGRALQC